MALVVEDGSGVVGAESYASVASADAYWAKRPQSPFAATWAAADVTPKEGALREGAGYMDAELGLLYPGDPKTTTQGLRCPRAKAGDATFIGFPPEISNANIELAARAVSSPLAQDTGAVGWLKKTRERVEGVVDIEKEYGAAGPQDGQYGAIFRSLNSFLIAQPPAGSASWAWA
jgi:hypothetical protein